MAVDLAHIGNFSTIIITWREVLHTALLKE